EDRDLRSRVVDVILLLDLVAARGEDARKRRADGRAPAVADVARAGRIRRYVLELQLLARADVARRVGLTGSGDDRGLRGGPLGREVEVEEARRRDAYLRDGGVRRHVPPQRLGHL